MSLQPEPDAVFGRRVRFVCGALLGLVMAFGFYLHVGPFGGPATVLVTGLLCASCGALAARYGDAFWRAAITLLRG